MYVSLYNVDLIDDTVPHNCLGRQKRRFSKHFHFGLKLKETSRLPV